MLRFALIVLMCCGAGSCVEAQIFGPVAVPVDPQKNRANYDNWLSLEVEAGANLISRRRLLYTLPTVENLRPGLAPRLGIKAVVFPAGGASLVLGFAYIRDRGTLEGYRKARLSNTFTVGETNPELLVEQNGDVMIDEGWLRGMLGLGIGIGPLDLTLAFATSGIITGRQRYDFEYTVHAFFDGVTGQTIPLDSPQTRRGSDEFHAADPSGGYGAAVIEVRWPINDRFRIQLEYEQGLHTNLNGTPRQEWRQRRSRIGLSAAYRLFSLKRV